MHIDLMQIGRETSAEWLGGDHGRLGVGLDSIRHQGKVAGKNGFDRYLEFQYGDASDFWTPLFRAIAMADGHNLRRLALGFPEEVAAYLVWTRVGVERFAEYVSKEHRFFDQFRKEYALD